MRYNSILIHYDEITLKGNNRPFFESMLIGNIKEFLKNISYDKIRKEGGTIVIDCNENTDTEKVREILKNISGISNYSFAIVSENSIKKICEVIIKFLKTNENKQKYNTFKIIAKRSNKKYLLKSPEINAKVGEFILESSTLKVDIHKPDLAIYVNIGEKEAYMYFEIFSGIGGLPTGTAGNLISLISGGIDSPVASYMMMKRGARITFAHFKNKTVAGDALGEAKIEDLIRTLNKFQGDSKLYVIPFDDFQKELITYIPAKNRMIIYRRIMLKIAENIAKKESAKGVVTGDSLSQVASQTLENISAAYRAISMPIFAPLIGMNKQEIISLAKKIGTYETSIIPHSDCCSLISSKHPETKAQLDEIEKQEKNIDIENLIHKILPQIKPKIIKSEQ